MNKCVWCGTSEIKDKEGFYTKCSVSSGGHRTEEEQEQITLEERENGMSIYDYAEYWS